MAGFGDTLKGMILGNTPAGKISNTLNKVNDGHTTSGMDQAMQNHADEIHPAGGGGKPQKTWDDVFGKK